MLTKKMLCALCVCGLVGLQLVAQTHYDRLNPKSFLVLEERQFYGIDQISLDPVVTYISPLTNIVISFSQQSLSATFDSVAGANKRELDSLRNISDALTQWKEEQIANLKEKESKEDTTADSAKISQQIKDVKEQYNKKKESVLKEILRITGRLPQIDLTIQARVILHTGKEYDLSVPGYVRADSEVVDSQKTTKVTSIQHGHYRITSEGLDDRLVETEIDIVAANLSDGDVVQFVATNHYGGAERNYTMRFAISDVGWKLEFPVSMIFVKRINEVTDSAGNPVNPSNFKPAPGGSLLLTYQPMGSITKKLFTSFGVGINASLVNFDIGKDFQVGIGPVIYYLNRSLGVGYGWDLNATEKRTYWFLSLDFLKTFDTFSALYKGG